MSGLTELCTIAEERIKVVVSARFLQSVDPQTRTFVINALKDYFTLLVKVLSSYINEPGALMSVLAYLTSGLREVEFSPPASRPWRPGDTSGSGGTSSGPT